MRHLWLKILPRTNTVYLIQISKLPIRGLEKKLKKKNFHDIPNFSIKNLMYKFTWFQSYAAFVG